jgi:hypothetical protein
MSFETFDFVRPDQCEIDPTVAYPIENFSNSLGVPFAVIPLDLTKSDLQDLNNLLIENTCPYNPDEPDPNRCSTDLSPVYPQPKSYYQNSTYRDNVEQYFKEYESLKPEPELMSRLVDLIVKTTNKVAEIMPDALMTVSLTTYAVESGMAGDYYSWHRDGDKDDGCDGTYMFLATLKGNPTLYCTGSYDSDKDQCVPSTSIFSAPLGYGTVHKFGNLYGAYHSAPPINLQRFLLIAFITHPECIKLDIARLNELNESYWIVT